MHTDRLQSLLCKATAHNHALVKQQRDLEESYQDGADILPDAIAAYEKSGFNPAASGSVIEPLIWGKDRLEPELATTIQSFLTSLLELQPYNLDALSTALAYAKMHNGDSSILQQLGQRVLAKAEEKLEEIKRLVVESD